MAFLVLPFALYFTAPGVQIPKVAIQANNRGLDEIVLWTGRGVEGILRLKGRPNGKQKTESHIWGAFDPTMLLQAADPFFG